MTGNVENGFGMLDSSIKLTGNSLSISVSEKIRVSYFT